MTLANFRFEESEVVSDMCWIDKRLDETYLKELLDEYQSEDGWDVEIHFSHITLDFQKLRKAFESPEIIPLDNAKKQLPNRRSAGRPPIHNWDLIWAELAVKADLEPPQPISLVRLRLNNY